MASSEELLNDSDGVAKSISMQLSQRYLTIIAQHLMSVVDHLSESDIPFAMRICVQGLTDSSNTELATVARELATALKQKIGDFSPDRTGFEEHCPACNQAIPLTSLSFGICLNGHRWGKR